MRPPQLKEREIQVLRLLAEGLSDRAIASRLSLAPETVRWYNKELYVKLDVTSRTQAVRRATALGLLDVPVAVRAASPAAASPVPRSPIQYVERGGVYIAYQTVGRGQVDLLFVHGFLSHIEIAWEEPEYAAFFEQLGRMARVILFDKRGIGLSDRTRGAPTLEETIGDAQAVLDAVGSTSAIVMGTSEGGACSVLLAMQRPERVHGLILVGTTARVARTGDEPAWAVPRAQFDQRIQQWQDTFGQPQALERFAPSRLHDARFAAWWSRILRAASSPSAIRAVLEVARDVDIRSLLPQVRTRTLVVHRTDDRLVPVDAGRYLAAHMPNATLVELPGADHIYFVDADPLVHAVAEFIARPDDVPAPSSWLAVILHMSGAGSHLNDEKRQILGDFAPRHLRVTPHGWTALFETPSRALACARRLRELGRGLVGAMSLHIGECRIADGIPIGVAHEVAQQLAGLANGGEIIVSETLRDILAGSGIPLERFTRSPSAGHAPAPFGWLVAD